MNRLVVCRNNKPSHRSTKKCVSSLKLFNQKKDLSKKKFCISGIKNVKTPYRRRLYFHEHPKVNPYNPLSRGYSRLSQLINIFPSVLKYIKYPLPDINILGKNEVQKEDQHKNTTEETKINAKKKIYYNKSSSKSVKRNILGLDIDACMYTFLVA